MHLEIYIFNSIYWVFNAFKMYKFITYTYLYISYIYSQHSLYILG